jgi:hypothetical protein
MVTKLNRDVKVQNKKTGEELIWKQGDSITIHIALKDGKRIPTVANIYHHDSGKDIHVPSRNLHKYADEFIQVTDEVVQDAIFDTCQSLTGETIEPDGYDPDGFPSVLLATGIC